MDLFEENWEAIRFEIRALRTTDGTLTPTIIRTMNVYNPYVDADKSADTWLDDEGNDFKVFKRYIDGVNTYIADNSKANGIPYADVYRAFNGPNGDIDPRTYRYISWDGLHPNDAGHKKMADLLRDLKYAPLK